MLEPLIRPPPLVQPLLVSPWRLVLNIGREDGARMPSEWGASGRRLRLQVDVRFHEDDAENTEFAEAERTIVPYEKTCLSRMACDPLSKASYVTTDGEQTLPVMAGAGALTLIPYAKEEGRHTLRFWLDTGMTGRIGDVELPAGRLFFFYDCWDRSQVADHQRRLRDIEERIANLEREVGDAAEFGPLGSLLDHSKRDDSRTSSPWQVLLDFGRSQAAREELLQLKLGTHQICPSLDTWHQELGFVLDSRHSSTASPHPRSCRLHLLPELHHEPSQDFVDRYLRST